MSFLKDLNENFAMVRSPILLMNSLPTTTTVFSMVNEHERQNNLTPIQEESQSLINLDDGKKPFVKHNGNWSP